MKKIVCYVCFLCFIFLFCSCRSQQFVDATESGSIDPANYEAYEEVFSDLLLPVVESGSIDPSNDI